MILQVGRGWSDRLPQLTALRVDDATDRNIRRALSVDEDADAHVSTESLQSALREIGNSFARALCQAVPAGSAMALVPCGLLGLLPWHLAVASGDDGSYGLLAERYRITYSLSGNISWNISDKRDSEKKQPLAVVDPNANLRFADIEGRIIRTHFPKCQILSKEATPAAVLAQLAGRSLVHVACHGNFDPARPYSSGLHLADGRFDVSSLLDANPPPLQSADLIVLASCETAVIDSASPDETIGLPRSTCRSWLGFSSRNPVASRRSCNCATYACVLR